MQEFEKEILVYDLTINKAYCLNETSANIWHLCDGTKTVEQISRSLSQKLKENISEDLIWLALDGFKKDNLLEQSEQFEINFNGLSRRQIIKKIGFASLVTLPVIAAVIAPQTAQAASCVGLLQPCSPPNSAGNCCPGVSYCQSRCVPCVAPNMTTNCLAPGNPGSQAFCNGQAYQCCSGSSVLQSSNGPGCGDQTAAYCACTS